MSVIDRGRSAERLLESGTLKEAHEAARARITQEWASCQAADRRESLWHQLQALDGILRELRHFRDTGTVAQKEAK